MRSRPRGKVAWPVFTVVCVATLALLWAAYELSGSAFIQWLVLLAAVLPWGPLTIRAGRTRPRPPAPPEMPRRRWLLVPMVLVGIALLIAAGWGSAALLDFDPGLWFWFFACFVVPLLAASNQFGMARPRAMRP